MPLGLHCNVCLLPVFQTVILMCHGRWSARGDWFPLRFLFCMTTGLFFFEQDPHVMGVLASLRQEQASLRAPRYAFHSPRPDCLRLRCRGKQVVPQAIRQNVVQVCHTYVHG